MATRWTHITIGVSDIERSMAFYEEFCGLKALRDRRLDGAGTVWLGYAAPEGENPQFVLVLHQSNEFARHDHFGFQCDTREEVDRIAERAAGRQILACPPTDSGGIVGYWTMLRDPDGHLVEFTCGQPLKGLS